MREAPRRVLFIQPRHSGDVLLTMPAVRLLKKNYPGAEIDFLAEPPHHNALLGTPHAKALVYDKKRPLAMIAEVRRRRYDWVLDYMGNPRTALLTALSGAPVRAGYSRVFHRWAYNLKYVQPSGNAYVAFEKMDFVSRLFGLAPAREEDILFDCVVPESSRAFAREFAAKALKTPLVTMAPNSQRHFNRWFPERYAAVADRLAERGACVLIVWGPGERPLAERIASLCRRPPLISPPTGTLFDLAAILEMADLHVGGDNGAKHVATAVGTRTFTIYGPHNPLCWTHPDRGRHRFIKKDCLCENDVRRKHSCRELACLNAVSTEEVRSAVEEFLFA